MVRLLFWELQMSLLKNRKITKIVLKINVIWNNASFAFPAQLSLNSINSWSVSDISQSCQHILPPTRIQLIGLSIVSQGLYVDMNWIPVCLLLSRQLEWPEIGLWAGEGWGGVVVVGVHRCQNLPGIPHFDNVPIIRSWFSTKLHLDNISNIENVAPLTSYSW